MAAPRKHSDAQRAEMHRLHMTGKSSAEIVALCETGTTRIEPFSTAN